MSNVTWNVTSRWEFSIMNPSSKPSIWVWRQHIPAKLLKVPENICWLKNFDNSFQIYLSTRRGDGYNLRTRFENFSALRILCHLVLFSVEIVSKDWFLNLIKFIRYQISRENSHGKQKSILVRMIFQLEWIDNEPFQPKNPHPARITSHPHTSIKWLNSINRNLLALTLPLSITLDHSRFCAHKACYRIYWMCIVVKKSASPLTMLGLFGSFENAGSLYEYCDERETFPCRNWNVTEHVINWFTNFLFPPNTQHTKCRHIEYQKEK